VRALGSFCDASRRDDIVSFFNTHKLPEATRTLNQTIERINNCIALRDAQRSAVESWLNANR
jgi:aminopeptidase N/puromycin-sensitive aminopeptidase